MKWFLAGMLICWAQFASGRDIPDIPELKENEPPSVPEVQCLAGTEWESHCHLCQCQSNGVATCLKQESCDSSIKADPIPCKPNSVFYRDCNSCMCLSNGEALCSSTPCRQSNVPKKSHLLSGKECSTGSEWTSQCNACHCTAEGYSSCTEMKCPGQDNERVLRCAPDTVWMNECNTCWCNSEGRSMCTRMGCLTLPALDFRIDDSDNKEASKPETDSVEYIMINDEHNLLRRSVCKPDSEFQMDCNPCICAEDGLSFTCTQNECSDDGDDDINRDVEVFMKNEGVDHIEKHSQLVCKPRVIFHIGCNTCHCNFDGSDFNCTNKPCPLPKDVEVFDEIKDCNTCWCNEDGTSYFCTRKVCVLEPAEEVGVEDVQEQSARGMTRVCRPDEVFELDCNMCHCNADGLSFSCTRRACYHEDDAEAASVSRKRRASSQELPKACQPGQEFRMDCNKCLCDNEGQDFSCTRIDCNALNNNNNGGSRRKRETMEEIITECKPGSVFQQSCNVCRCGTDGRRASCTTHHCHVKRNYDAFNPPDTDPNFRCNPGEQFKRNCNDCTCSADGKSVFCTLLFCSVYDP